MTSWRTVSFILRNQDIFTVFFVSTELSVVPPYIYMIRTKYRGKAAILWCPEKVINLSSDYDAEFAFPTLAMCTVSLYPGNDSGMFV